MKTESVSCDFCKSGLNKIIRKTKDKRYPEISDFEFNILKCKNCNLAWTNPRPTQETIHEFYPPSYPPHGVLKKSKGIMISIKKILLGGKDPDKLFGLEWIDKKGKVLDVGCGGGQYLSSVKEKGWETYGVDTSKLAIENATKLGAKTFLGQLKDAKFEDNTFDVVTIREALEHVHNPTEVVNEMYRILKPEGHLIILVPNVSSMNSKIFRSSWNHLDVPRHLYHFNEKSLKNILSKIGFGKIKFYQEPWGGFNFSINLITKNKIYGLIEKTAPIWFGVNWIFALFGRGDAVISIAQK